VTVPTVAVATLGCRLNQVDSDALARRLEAGGFRTIPFEARADVVVVNTCTVTGRADASDRRMIRRARRLHPDAPLVVTGCWAQTDPEAVAALREVDVVVGNADKDRLAAIVGDLARDGRRARRPRIEVSDVRTTRALLPAPMPRVSPRARAFLKVQDGCQHRCSFCIVPRARGSSRSLDPRHVLDEAARFVDLGCRELVLTGVDLGHYGADLRPRTTLAALLRALVAVPGLARLRLSSVLPAYFTPELFEIVTGGRVIAPHLHIPLQSGSDRVLRAMRRPYTVAMYRVLVERLSAAMPRLGLGADVIVGFPGETEDEFAATMTLVESLPLSYLHVFGYSDRAGTAAAALGGRIDGVTVARRSRELRALAARKNQAFRRSMIGERHDGIVLEHRDRETGSLVGLTGNYVEVVFDGPDALRRTMASLRVTDATDMRTRGEVAA
jgi:threonylcarbamoyladenosine tRNA methylthiotransferase MtaB